MLGTDEAATLMGYLPPVGWAEVATKHDLTGLRSEMSLMHSEMSQLHSEMSQLRSEMSQLRSEVRAEILGLRSDAATHLRTLVLAMTGSILTTATLAFAAARFS